MPAHTNRQAFIVSFVFLLAASGIACSQKIGKPVLATPAAPASAIPAPAEPMEQPPPPPAQIAAEPPVTLPQLVRAPPPEEPVQTKKPKRSSRPAARAIPATAPPTSQPLRLGEMLTPAQERQYNAAMDQSLRRAQANIAIVSKRRLSSEQRGVVAQVQSFIEQAQSTRKTNLTAAKSLAERADVLARDLARTTR